MSMHLSLGEMRPTEGAVDQGRHDVIFYALRDVIRQTSRLTNRDRAEQFMRFDASGSPRSAACPYTSVVIE